MRQTASLLGIPYTTYVGYEKNKREPNSETLTLIASFFNCTVDYLMGLEPNPSFTDNEPSTSLGELIKKRRLELGLTLEQVGDAVGVGKSTVKKWEDGYISNMRRDKISALAKVLQLNPVSLITGNESLPQDDLDSIPGILHPIMRKIPLLGKTACGEPIYSPNYDDGYALLNEDYEADFALQAQGDSMTGAGIQSGDIVFFVAQETVDNGQIAAVFIDEEVTLKRVYYYKEKNKLILQPENPAYEPLVYVGEELNSIRIIGRAVAHLRRL